MTDRWYIIDGYSVLHRMQAGGFADRAAMARARRTFVDRVAGALPGKSCRVTIVFDGQAASTEPAGFGDNIDLVFTGKGQTADAYIERLAASLAQPGDAIVVSSDRAVVESAAAAGCRVLTARAYLEELDGSQRRHRRQMKRALSKPGNRGPRLGDFFPGDAK